MFSCMMLLNRAKIEFYLIDLETPVGKAIDLTIAALVLVSSGIFVAETYNIAEDAHLELITLDNCVLIISAGGYLLQLWSGENKTKYILRFY